MSKLAWKHFEILHIDLDNVDWEKEAQDIIALKKLQRSCWGQEGWLSLEWLVLT